ncbi:MAG: T9SS type A sorting domain-containing protein [Bacteroidetes bacterium]|nr:T9SS type A sorting domain-containing protein [Bacteroidota bacterium]
MKFILATFLCLVFIPLINAQTIPGGSQQPQWVFPIYFEEGAGQRDTIYVGYDPSSTYYIGNQLDAAFGEKWILTDSVTFHAFTLTGVTGHDTVVKVDVRPGMFSFTLRFKNGILPLKISWDVSLFRSSALPFPNLNPLPRVQGILGHNAYSLNPDLSYCPLVARILITDTNWFNSADHFCIRKDSALIEDIFTPNRPIPLFSFEIKPWTGIVPVAINEIEDVKPYILVYPNPTSNYLSIKFSNPLSRYDFVIYNMLGQLVKTGSVEHSTTTQIDLTDINPGLHLLQISTENPIVHYHKLIIVE